MASKAALTALNEIAHPNSARRDIQTLANRVGEIAYRNRLELDVTDPLVQRVFDPTGSKLNIVAAEAWLGLLHGRLRVVRFLRAELVDDDLLEYARVAYRSMYPSIRNTPSTEVSGMVNEACNMLTVLLSLELQRRDEINEDAVLD